MVFRDNGAVEKYNLTMLLSYFLEPMAKYKWSMIEGEVYIKDEHGGGGICRINPDGGLTPIAGVRNGNEQISQKMRKRPSKVSSKFNPS